MRVCKFADTHAFLFPTRPHLIPDASASVAVYHLWYFLMRPDV